MSSDAPLSGPDLAAGIADDDLREGVPLLGHAHGDAILLVRDQGRVHAVGATCTHYGGPLAEGIVTRGAINRDKLGLEVEAAMARNEAAALAKLVA